MCSRMVFDMKRAFVLLKKAQAAMKYGLKEARQISQEMADVVESFGRADVECAVAAR